MAWQQQRPSPPANLIEWTEIYSHRMPSSAGQRVRGINWGKFAIETWKHQRPYIFKYTKIITCGLWEAIIMTTVHNPKIKIQRGIIEFLVGFRCIGSGDILTFELSKKPSRQEKDERDKRKTWFGMKRCVALRSFVCLIRI